MTAKTEGQILVAFCLLACAGIILMTVAMTKSANDFDRDCRAAGGVPVRTYLSRNCATSGYIDIYDKEPDA